MTERVENMIWWGVTILSGIITLLIILSDGFWHNSPQQQRPDFHLWVDDKK